MLLAAFLSVAFAQPPKNHLEVEGACPDVTFVGTEFHPGSPVVMLFSETAGMTKIPNGPCKGKTTGLGDLHWRRFAKIPTSGDFRYNESIPEPACDFAYQLLDLRTCEVSNVVGIPASLPVDTGDTGL